jgi:hypothetical protein
MATGEHANLEVSLSTDPERIMRTFELVFTVRDAIE